MDTETTPRLPIDAHLIARDETEFWSLEYEHMQHIERICGVYLFDSNTHTYLCEIQPSYWLHPVYTFVVYREGTSDEMIDTIDQIVSYNDGDGMYVHVSEMNRLIAISTSLIGYKHLGTNDVSYDDCPYDEQIDALIEHFNCNTPF